jgi:aldehyde dehydrogenase (NAD+)
MQSITEIYIDGGWVKPHSAGVNYVTNPATEQSFASVPSSDEYDVDRAVLAAHRAFPTWSGSRAAERADFIRAIAQGMTDRADELAAAISKELGMPMHLAREVQVDGPIEGMLSYADQAFDMEKEETTGNATIIKEAVGVCAFINPWNYPLHQLVGKIAPAFAAGCTMVVKPSEETPLHAFILAEIIHDAGLPAGVFNLVPGSGRVVGEALSCHRLVDMVSFTGSTGAGVRVAEVASHTVKRVCLELGGKSPFIITDNADFSAAVAHGVHDVMINSGQTCTALTRMLVPQSCYEQAMEIAKTVAQSLTVGDPMDPTSHIGPMCSERQKNSVLRYIEQGLEEGATLVTGGIEPPPGCEQGFYVQPTIFANVNNDMSIAREEIFGPVLCMIAYEDIDEAITLANDTEFGLSSGVWAGTEEQAMQIARQIRAGQVFVNGGDFNYRAPFGGYKQSGNGREWGAAGLDEFVEIKAIMR